MLYGVFINYSRAKELILIGGLALITTVAVLFTTSWKKYWYTEHGDSSLKIGVLDSKRLRRDAKCFSVHEILAKRLDRIIQKMQQEESIVKSEYNVVQKNTTLQKSQKKKEIAVIENKWNAISQKYKQQLQNIRDQEILVSEKIKDELEKAISKVANANKIDLVLNTESRDSVCIFYFSDKLDVTEAIISQLDESLPIVKLGEEK